ncbi:RHS repeat protein, partial [Candidatus Microgenomates bacterium]|nr:RHS repeat protein [Candidatus Microgenomates bacterium]
TGQAAVDKWKQEYNYGVYQAQSLSNALTPPSISTNQSQNNGNIGHIKLTPGSGQNPISQFFAYDELNRLKVAKEYYAKITRFAPSQGISSYPNAIRSYLAQINLDGANLVNVASIEVSPNQGVSVTQFFLSAQDLLTVNLLADGLTGAGLRTVKALDAQGQVLAQGRIDISLPPVIIEFSGCCGEASQCRGGTYRIVDPNDPVNGVLTLTQSNIFNFPPTVIGDQTISVSTSENLFNEGFTVTNSLGQRTNICLLNFSRANPGGKGSLDLGNGKDQEQKDNKPNPANPYYLQIFDPDTLSWAQEYSYDRYGNRFQVQGTNSQNQNLAISASKNRITDEGFVYDNAGNLIKDPNNRDYFYDAENRLIKVSVNLDGNTFIIARYFYDGNGWRVKKVRPSVTTRFVYDQGGRLLSEYDGETVAINSATREHIYAPSGMLATVEPDKINYHTPDHLGSPRILTDATGSVISRRDFYPFGEMMPDSIGNRFSVPGYSVTDTVKQRFTGYFRDEETDLDFAQARYF